MALKVKKTNSTKRFGTRYGKALRDKMGAIEAEQRKKHKCPYCNAVRVRRISAGIWNCTKCNKKFTGKAYTIAKKKVKKEETEDIEEKTQEEEK